MGGLYRWRGKGVNVKWRKEYHPANLRRCYTTLGDSRGVSGCLTSGEPVELGRPVGAPGRSMKGSPPIGSLPDLTGRPQASAMRIRLVHYPTPCYVYLGRGSALCCYRLGDGSRAGVTRPPTSLASLPLSSTPCGDSTAYGPDISIPCWGDTIESLAGRRGSTVDLVGA
jgi:hypothetical protein